MASFILVPYDLGGWCVRKGLGACLNTMAV